MEERKQCLEDRPFEDGLSAEALRGFEDEMVAEEERLWRRFELTGEPYDTLYGPRR